MLAVGLILFGLVYFFLTGWLVVDLGRTARIQAEPGGTQSGSGLRPLPLERVQRILDAGFLVSLLVFLLGAARSQPWHLIWPVSLAGLSAQRWAWPVVMVLSAMMLVSQIWVEWGTPGLTVLF
jgi:hypothetical protein